MKYHTLKNTNKNNETNELLKAIDKGEKWNLKSDFADVVMQLIGDEITTLDALVYADKYLEYFGVNDTKCYIRYYNKAMKHNKYLPSDCEFNLMHDLMLTRDSNPSMCVPRTAYTI